MDEVPNFARMEDQTSELLRPSEVLNKQAPDVDVVASEAHEHVVVRYGFEVAGIGLLLEEQTQSEVVEAKNAYALPNTPKWLTGLINLRGNLVPIFDLRVVLDFDRSRVASGGEAAKEYFLVVDKGERAAGFVTEQLPAAVRDIGGAISTPVIPAVLREHVSGAWLRSDRVWFEFDHRSFLETLTSRLKSA